MWRSVSSDDILEQTHAMFMPILTPTREYVEKAISTNKRIARQSAMERAVRLSRHMTHFLANQKERLSHGIAEEKPKAPARRKKAQQRRLMSRLAQGPKHREVAARRTVAKASPQKESVMNMKAGDIAASMSMGSSHTYRWLKSGTAPDEVTMCPQIPPRAVSAGNATQAQLDRLAEVERRLAELEARQHGTPRPEPSRPLSENPRPAAKGRGARGRRLVPPARA